MLQIRVTGKEKEVEPFLHDLKRCPQFEWVNEAFSATDYEINTTCSLRHDPCKGYQVVHLYSENGEVITIPLSGMILAEMEEGKRIIAGWHFDIFA
ncbi:DUF3970 family protein [Thermoactinomyces mirandus]|uniref:DUF3970 family protein n=1 Tax=Thermoactinomyces mirandus TaxID=2756294 RepID=A0A7W2ASD9_9BACL|nr:DUF3970 family protein [Thermoactinomyces mirandus]MBA4603518.1 DUF3970 family protein [Thermoactinomyces mirandus]